MIRAISVISVFLAVATYAIDMKCDTYLTDPVSQKVYHFDLSKLHHDSSVYIDTLFYRTSKNDIYYVNFCGQTASDCESHNTSVCLRTPNGSGYDYVTAGRTTTQTFSVSKGEKVSDSITVTYSEGVQCSYGRRKRTRIVLKCQQTANPGFFYDIDEIDDCEVTLYMWSSAACGKLVNSTSSSSSETPEFCHAIIKDPKSTRKYEYNLLPLYHDEKTYIDTLWYRTAENYIYYVNFCGQTASACDSSDTSVCLRIPNGETFKYISAGSTSTQTFSPSKGEPIYGSVTVTYSDGAKCGKDRKLKTNLIVKCQTTANPGYFYNLEQVDECEVNLYMWSSSGCGRQI